MSHNTDAWYVRTPDGRVLRANSTASLRHHFETGNLPLDSRVRRTPLDDWTSLKKVEAFADLATFALERGQRADASRSGPVADAAGRGLGLRAVGARSMVTDLLPVFDSALTRGKLLTAGVLGLAAGVAVVLGWFTPQWVSAVSPWYFRGAAGLLLLVVYAVTGTLLARGTYIELAHFRPASWSEAAAGLPVRAARLLFAALAVVGGVVLLMIGLRELPGWLLTQTDSDAAAAAAAVLRLVVEVLLWPVLGFSLLLGPILVVEDCSAAAALDEWARLLRRHFGRVFLYEAAAAALAALACLPFLVPVELAARTAAEPAAAEAAAWLLRGLALTPALAFLLCVNVFIYLTLRYEHAPLR
jgi:hypothetical protein